jgi:glycosyltransferase involved in cell wall biosynthesis
MPDSTPPIIWLDLSPMGERQHTGISNVAKFLARVLLADREVEGRFFAGRSEIGRDLVEHLIALDGGEIIEWLRQRQSGGFHCGADDNRRCAGIFTAAKAQRRLFPYEVQIVHDVTTIVTPQYHDAGSLRFWNRQIYRDAMTSDLIVAVSQSTLDDLHAYVPETLQKPAIVAHLAPCIVDPPARAAHPLKKPYIVVLGTLEPRKNVGFVLECLGERPEWLSRATFVFVGRWGWGETTQDLIARHGLGPAVERQDIIFTGFVEDRARDALIVNSTLVIYISRYEGFGLPVIEALHCGAPVLTSYSSSLPEAGGDQACYCDFDSSQEFFGALERIFAAESGDDVQNRRMARKAYARRFTWEATYDRIKNEILKSIR